MREEGIDFLLAHVHGMTLVVKQYVSPDPVNVGFLGPQTHMTDSQGISHLIQKPRRFRCGVPVMPLLSAAEDRGGSRNRLHPIRRPTRLASVKFLADRRLSLATAGHAGTGV